MLAYNCGHECSKSLTYVMTINIPYLNVDDFLKRCKIMLSHEHLSSVVQFSENGDCETISKEKANIWSLLRFFYRNRWCSGMDDITVFGG